jgi:hypothetical protein
MGRTEAEAEGWTKINTVCESAGDGNSFAGFRYENPEDEGVVLIFDVNGIIAGIQARVSIEIQMLKTLRLLSSIF